MRRKNKTTVSGKKGGNTAPRNPAKKVNERNSNRITLGKNPKYAVKPVQRKKYLPEEVHCKIVKLGRNFGFATPFEEGADIFIPGGMLKGTMPGDEVMVRLFAEPRIEGSREGEVSKIVSYTGSLVGSIRKQNDIAYFVADSTPDIMIRLKKGGMVEENGSRVAADIVRKGNHHSDHRATIVMRFGPADSAKECAKAIVYGAGVSVEFPQDVIAQVRGFSNAEINHADVSGREDLRNEIIFTIDSASTKDIDDAISIKRLASGYELGVHIADVSHYVTARSPLDKEAMLRGTSIYYADQVIPMLPKELSNGICSLNPKVERLAFSCFIKLDKNAKMQSHRFEKTVICSKMQGVYSEINSIFEDVAGDDIKVKYAEILPSLKMMYELYKKLVSLRTGRGNIDIESDEPYLKLDNNGVCIGIDKRTRGNAEKLIEEFMLLANTAAATLARTKALPFVYRVHESPPAEKIETLKNILDAANVKYHFQGEAPTQDELAKILDVTRGTSMQSFVHTGVLRSMAKAKYEPLPKGHYGLALQDYSHFTSPIRRYPDLSIHRILSDYVAGMPVPKLQKKYHEFAERSSVRSSEREIIAQKIERSCDDCYKAEYMSQFIGEEFDGQISSVTAFGIYIELGNTIDGLVRASSLSSGEMVLQKGIMLSDPLSGKTYRVGDAAKVKLIAVDIAHGNIDFELVLSAG